MAEDRTTLVFHENVIAQTLLTRQEFNLNARYPFIMKLTGTQTMSGSTGTTYTNITGTVMYK